MKRFIVVSPARSGSTALRMAINRHPQAVCHGEILATHRVIGASQHTSLGQMDPEELMAIRDLDPAGFVNLALDNAGMVSGFKIIYFQFENAAIAAGVEKLVTDRKLLVVFLWRQNLARRYLSEMKLRAQFRARNDQPAEIVIDVDAATMLQDCRNQIATRERMRDLFKDHPHLDLVFEDIAERKEIPEVNDFLDLSAPMVRLSDGKDDYISSTTIVVPNELELMAAYDVAEPELHGR